MSRQEVGHLPPDCANGDHIARRPWALVNTRKREGEPLECTYCHEFLPPDYKRPAPDPAAQGSATKEGTP